MFILKWLQPVNHLFTQTSFFSNIFQQQKVQSEKVQMTGELK